MDLLITVRNSHIKDKKVATKGYMILIVQRCFLFAVLLAFCFVANYLNLVKTSPYRFQKDQYIKNPGQPTKCFNFVHAGFTLHTIQHRHFDSFRLTYSQPNSGIFRVG